MAETPRPSVAKVSQTPTNTTKAPSNSSTSKTTVSGVKETTGDVKQKSGGASLADFLLHLEDYTPTVTFQNSLIYTKYIFYSHIFVLNLRYPMQ